MVFTSTVANFTSVPFPTHLDIKSLVIALQRVIM